MGVSYSNWPNCCWPHSFALDSPGAATSTQYGLYIANTTGTDTATFLGNAAGGTPTANMIIEEIMGALEPANDNHALQMTG